MPSMPYSKHLNHQYLVSYLCIFPIFCSLLYTDIVNKVSLHKYYGDMCIPVKMPSLSSPPQKLKPQITRWMQHILVTSCHAHSEKMKTGQKVWSMTYRTPLFWTILLKSKQHSIIRKQPWLDYSTKLFCSCKIIMKLGALSTRCI